MQSRTRTQDHAQTLERAFAIVGLTAAVGTLGGGSIIAQGASLPSLVAAASAVLLVCSLAGIWASDVAKMAQKRVVARIYAQALQGSNDAGVERRRGRQRVSWSDGISEAFRAPVRQLKTQEAPQPRFPVDDFSRLQGRIAADAQFAAVASKIAHDAEAVLHGQLAVARSTAAEAEAATGRLAEEADELGLAIADVSRRAEQSTAAVLGLTHAAFATQRSIGVVAASTTALLQAADEVTKVLQRADMLGLGAEIEAARLGEAAGELPIIAAELKQLAACGVAALNSMQVLIRDLGQQIGQASQSVQDVSDAVQEQHEAGHAWSAAAMSQSDAIGRLLHDLSATRQGIVKLHAHLRDIGSPSHEQSNQPSAAEQIVGRVPEYAFAMAEIVRGLPQCDIVSTVPAE